MNGPNFNFCVTAMPRCGLGWISSFLSYGSDLICYSEAITRAIGVRSHIPEIEPSRVTGNADPMYLLSPSWIGEIEKVVLVRRSLHAVRSSIMNSGMDKKLYDYGAKNMETLVESGAVTLVVDYEKLFSGNQREVAAEELWSHILPSVKFDKNHFRRCCELHVNPRAIK